VTGRIVWFLIQVQWVILKLTLKNLSGVYTDGNLTRVKYILCYVSPGKTCIPSTRMVLGDIDKYFVVKLQMYL